MLLALKQGLLRKINEWGHRLPKTLQRKIADFPGVLAILERSSRNVDDIVLSPEGYKIAMNPLFHAYVVENGDLRGYEPEIRTVLEMLCSPGMVAYDIGANIGIFTLLFAARVGPGGRVYAFEP